MPLAQAEALLILAEALRFGRAAERLSLSLASGFDAAGRA